MARKFPGRAFDSNSSITVTSIVVGGASIQTDSNTGAIALIPKSTNSNPNPIAAVVAPTGGITTVNTTSGVVTANNIGAAAAANTASPVRIDVTTSAPANGQALIWSSSANTFVPGNVAAGNTSSDIPKIIGLIYPSDDTAANTSGGQTVYIRGSNFAANCVVYINGSAVPSVTFISSSNVGFTTPALSANVYPVYVINPGDGATAIHIPGLNVSGVPSWSTTEGSIGTADLLGAWSFNVLATSDSSITYTLAAGSSLPTGITLASNGLISGTLSSPPASDTTYTFSVVATDAENQDATRQFTVTATVSDPYFPYTTLLLHGDGTNNANNNTFIDSSNNNFTITRNGNTSQGTFSPYGNTWSVLFSSNTTYLSLADTANIRLGSGDFTVECFIQTSQTGNTFTSGIAGQYVDAGAAGCYILGVRNNVIWIWDNATSYTGTANVATNTWTHIAWVRSGSSSNNNKVYVNGVLDFQFTNTTNFTGGTAPFRIGSWGSSTSSGFTANTYISNFRIIKNATTYTGTFTPPTSQLTAVSNTAILACQSNRFNDNSTNAFTLTVNGTLLIQRFSPFNLASGYSYSAANTGGSAYIGGNGNYLSFSGNSAFAIANSTTPFTVEMWIYPTASTGVIFSEINTGAGDTIPIAITMSDAITLDNPQGKTIAFGYYNGGWSSAMANAEVTLNAWTHIACVFTGSTTKIYLNGVNSTKASSPTPPTTWGATGANGTTWYIGKRWDSSTNNFTGYISNLRFVNGTAVYTSNFTPPTAPLTAIANTALLNNYTNAGILDNAMINVIETFGDAKISTAQYKYGTSSIYFDGTGDYLNIPSTNLLNFGTGDFTVECWVRHTTIAVDTFYISASGSGGLFFGIGGIAFNNTTIGYGRAGVAWDYYAAHGMSANTWYHVALTRSGTSIRMFVNGTQVGTTQTSSTSYSLATTSTTVGSQGAAYYYNGYIDDLRITKGYARYTSNFTAPTSAFKDR